MDETNVPFFTPESKEGSKQWVLKGSRTPVKFKSQVSKKKQMVISFFDNEGLIYQNYVPIGTKVNADYFVGSLQTFLKNVKTKRPTLVEKG